jgi:hypothetical protein
MNFSAGAKFDKLYRTKLFYRGKVRGNWACSSVTHKQQKTTRFALSCNATGLYLSFTLKKQETMNRLILLFFLLLSTVCYIQAQSAADVKTTHSEVRSYTPQKPESNQLNIQLHVDYGGAEIINVFDVALIGFGEIKSIKLYYSDFPKGKDFKQLNLSRIQDFLDLSGLSPTIPIELVKQTQCNSQEEAKSLFHGFEIILEIEEIDFTAIQLDTAFKDFVVEAVLDRNDWTEMLVVSDLTGSMSPYASQLFLWLKLNTIEDKINQFVFFNDGNTTMDVDKKIGSTGGIFETRSKEYDEVEMLATQCMMNGSGGDLPENDLEALIKGLELCPDCKENILIVDNNSPVRDFELLKQIKKPIRIILCGSYGNVNAQYLNIARRTKGSVHLMEEDLFHLMELNEGESITVDGKTFIIKKDRFVEVEKM